MFQPVDTNVNFPKQEESILAFWKQARIYDKSLAARQDAPRFVFFEGPPTANGLPHPGHCLTRAIKDLFPRYRTMRGYLCERKAGWDTHGLPVEVEVCKQLGIHSKEEIEAYGIEPFIQKCQSSVWQYMQQWEQLTERLGFWLKLDEAYVTYHQSYIESVWWSLKQLFDRGLLYQGYKIVWWWAQGGTALSSGEVGQGYRSVADPSIYVLFPLVDVPNTSLVIWTTTPWTLPSNQFAAVNRDLLYATVVDEEKQQRYIVASELVETIAEKIKRPLRVESRQSGADLVGLRYRPPMNYYYDRYGETQGELVAGGQQHIGWRIVAADFVSLDSGTGAVHEAPAFGDVDFELLQTEQARFRPGEGPTLLCAVGPDGRFTQDAPDLQGKWVKDADREIIRELKSKGLLLHQEQYVHEYPFCWRAEEDPLIQYPRRSWFIRTRQYRDAMLANNSEINWLPSHIRDGRFGNFLESNVDWALSRERFWGTPLPIWQCSKTGQREAIARYDDLLVKPGIQGTEVWDEAKRLSPHLPEDLKVHKPYIDAIEYDSPFHPEGRMQRVPDVIDCWYDSGAMPFAQWGWPHQGADQFSQQFPADFISEAIDQTRGWFYSLVAISTMLFGRGAAAEAAVHRNLPGEATSSAQPASDQAAQAMESQSPPHPFRNCIVLGLMLGEDGEKMSKSRRNYREPQEIFDRYGADALRWYFFANQLPWTSIRYREQAIKDSIPEFLLRLWNVYSFFVVYANLDQFNPAEHLDSDVGDLDSSVLAGAATARPPGQRGELDRWILSELAEATREIIQRMDAYDNFAACARLTALVDALSNWYVRRSRDRFWSSDTTSPDKLDAYWTLYECLLTTAKLIAPFVPFVAESMWQNLAGVFGSRATESVHLCRYPEPDEQLIDEQLTTRMALLREIASLGRAARMDAKIKVRQPLSRVTVVLRDAEHQHWLKQHDALLREELNVKHIEYTTETAELVTYQVQPNFKRLGPRVGGLMPAVKKAFGTVDAAGLLGQLKQSGTATIDVDGQSIELDQEDVQVRLQANAGFTAAQGTRCVVVLATELTQELVLEGLAREVNRLVQDMRKDMDLQFSDRIVLSLVTEDENLREAISMFAEMLRTETLAVELNTDHLHGSDVREFTIGQAVLKIAVTRASEVSTNR